MTLPPGWSKVDWGADLMYITRWQRYVLAPGFFGVVCACAWAQEAAPRGTLAGTLLDPSDTPVSSAPVRLISSAGEAETRTGGRGEFRFDNLAPGDYEIQVALEGFDPIRRKARLGVRSIQNLNLRLTLARLRQELTVAEPTYQVNTDSTRNADTISVEGSVLDNLPVLDLNYLSALSRFLEAGAPGGGGTSLIVDGMEMRNVGVTASAIQEIRIKKKHKKKKKTNTKNHPTQNNI